MMVDPDGEWAFIALAAVVGAYAGGAKANGTLNPIAWDWESGKTWGYVVGGAAIGAASAGLGAAVYGATVGPVGLATGSGLTGAVTAGTAAGAASGSFSYSASYILNEFHGMDQGSYFSGLVSSTLIGGITGGALSAATYGLSAAYRWDTHERVLNYAYDSGNGSVEAINSAANYAARVNGIDPESVLFTPGGGFAGKAYGPDSPLSGRIDLSDRAIVNESGQFSAEKLYYTVWHEGRHQLMFANPPAGIGSIGAGRLDALHHSVIFRDSVNHPYFPYWSSELRASLASFDRTFSSRLTGALSLGFPTQF